jgi:membrane associated rhomboid family serine protease
MNIFQGSPYRSSYPVVKNLIIINVLMLLGTYAFANISVDLTRMFGLHYFSSVYFKPYQYVTHMFMHGGITHIFFNMFALWMFGKVLENVWGSKRFLVYYFVTGLGAALLHTFVNYIQLSALIEQASAFANTPSPELFELFIKKHISNPSAGLRDFMIEWEQTPFSPYFINEAVSFVKSTVEAKINIPTVGASGAVFGVLLAFGVLFPNVELMLLFPPIPIKAKYFVIIYGVIELYLGLTRPGSNIAHFAHLGGMIFGFILIKIWSKQNKNHFY